MLVCIPSTGLADRASERPLHAPLPASALSLSPTRGGVRMRIDIGDIVRGVQQRLSVLGAPERLVSELLDMLRDTHRILLRFEETMDRLDKLAQSWDEKISSVDMSPERFARLEQALFNIERGMT